jgi:hypothetical protein
MIVSREYLLSLSEKPIDSARLYAECIVADRRIDAREGRTIYISRRFPIEIAGFCSDIIRQLCEILPDVHIFTMRDARHNNTYIVLDWTTEYVCMDYSE